ncbi:MAG: undecaprenyl/decaprenyl-phosphate alpha-N-acetylglucosaminyl 1-phosphate transferase [Clostridia bacterium]|nr:undecaprenyl/decaprenyl-phosphate alpha-N-acetylglucosaminyl 1-phosphate transferase [Clostridia bacterium]
MKYILSLLMVFLIVYAFMPFFKKFALKIGFVDQPTERKKHKEPIPLIGGVVLFLGFLCGYLILIRPINQKFISILAASFLILFIGLVDDWYKTHGKEFSVWPRLFIQILSAIMVYSSGIVFYGFTNPFTQQYIVLPAFMQFILTILWVLGVTTVINWSDGMDGLAGSLTAIAASTLFVVALAKGQNDSALLAVVVVGAVLGFLRYNRHPAQVFMGDSGANFLGFVLGVIALDGAFKQATFVSILIPVLALGVPIFDNLFVVTRRFLNGQPIYKADAGQIHHRLLSSGLNPKQVVTFISLISVCLSLMSIIILLLKI